MMSRSALNKDKCDVCKGLIMPQSKFMVCSECNHVTHRKCAKLMFEFNHLENVLMCHQCTNNKLKRYNIFNDVKYLDKHDPCSLHDTDDLYELSEILNNCEIYDIKRFIYLSDSLHTADNINFSCLCNNIDGNASNFDHFTSVILAQMKNYFSVIALTETNIDICHKNLYHIPNYTSEYNEKFSGKSKGTGIGLYIHNEFIFNRINKFSRYTKNMESLFVTITNTNVPITVGVVYRPPSGLIKNFLNEWESIVKQLPEKNVIIMGDFDIDLLQPNTDFEGALYSNNFIPIITLATHEKPGCKPSLIDNMFINSSNSMQNAGIIK